MLTHTHQDVCQHGVLFLLVDDGKAAIFAMFCCYFAYYVGVVNLGVGVTGLWRRPGPSVIASDANVI